MKIHGIYSTRGTTSSPAYDLVYEWEDEIARTLNVPIKTFGLSERIAAKLPGALPKDVLFGRNRRYLRFVLNAMDDSPLFNHPSCVPVIIDFYVSDERLARFVEIYNRCHTVLITSRQAYDRLKYESLPFEVRHWPLSLPTKYAVAPDIDLPKRHGLTLLGRQNKDKRIMQWVDRYRSEHPGFEYVYQGDSDMSVSGGYTYRCTDGSVIGPTADRDAYIQLIKDTRAAIYSTPATGGRPGCNGFDQVTPKLLEMINFRCNVLLMYPDNSDTRYFGLFDIGPNITDYSSFAASLDHALSHDADPEACARYISRHTTAEAIRLLSEMP